MPACEPVDVDFLDRASVVATANVSVEASPQQVWKILNDTDRWPDWFEGMKTARVTSPSWDGVGSTRFVKVGPMGVDERIIAWEPDQRWGFCVTALSATGWIARRMVEVIDIEPDGTGSRLTYRGALDPVPWLKPLGGLLKRRLSTAWKTSLANIDSQLDRPS